LDALLLKFDELADFMKQKTYFILITKILSSSAKPKVNPWSIKYNLYAYMLNFTQIIRLPKEGLSSDSLIHNK
jgi:hypothetical protein